MVVHSEIIKPHGILTKWETDKWKNSLRFIRTDSHILDIGCADCLFFDYIGLDKEFLCGFDIDATALIMASKKGYTIFSDLQKVKGIFDIITMWEMIEHIPLELFIGYLDYCKLHLKKEGLVLISTPNILNIFYPFWAQPMHIKPYCLSSLISVLESRGFEVVVAFESHPLKNPLKVLFSKCLGLSIYSKIFVAVRIKQ
jgi:2-polyprenyl-3-methyl-5-hydroxy-6-metoxy-1,4-benzoquinol methylase